ncbi:hypothetical protein [Paenibacillus turpanensis]|uniref:hypothetical protein n=1 Tax=Paenibacillus turpanensis TaxID=2689078 RepID=UPI00140A6030|nr:hypothetical protein [Paenibacillus turpanensis]
MQEKPYFCPNCRSNRVKFALLETTSTFFMKDAINGSVSEMGEPQLIEEADPQVQCMVCRFVGNELRFVKQAEREPRTETTVASAYR